MNKDEAKEIVDEYLETMRWKLQLQDWGININYTRIKQSGTIGMCRADPKYKRADIDLDYDLIENKTELLRTLRHELFHIMHSHFEVYRKAVSHLVTENEFDAIDEIFIHAAEDCVLKLENMLDHGIKKRAY